MGAATPPGLHLLAPCGFLSTIPSPRVPLTFPWPLAAVAGTRRRDPHPRAARGTPVPLPTPLPWFSQLCPPVHPGGPLAGPLGNAARAGSVGNIKQVQPLQSPFERGQRGACSQHGEPGQARWLLGGRGDPHPHCPLPVPPAPHGRPSAWGWVAWGARRAARGPWASRGGSHVGVRGTKLGSLGSTHCSPQPPASFPGLREQPWCRRTRGDLGEPRPAPSSQRPQGGRGGRGASGVGDGKGQVWAGCSSGCPQSCGCPQRSHRIPCRAGAPPGWWWHLKAGGAAKPEPEARGI